MGGDPKYQEPFAFIIGIGLLLLLAFALGYYAGWYGWLYF